MTNVAIVSSSSGSERDLEGILRATGAACGERSLTDERRRDEQRRSEEEREDDHQRREQPAVGAWFEAGRWRRRGRDTGSSRSAARCRGRRGCRRAARPTPATRSARTCTRARRAAARAGWSGGGATTRSPTSTGADDQIGRVRGRSVRTGEMLARRSEQQRRRGDRREGERSRSACARREPHPGRADARPPRPRRHRKGRRLPDSSPRLESGDCMSIAQTVLQRSWCRSGNDPTLSGISTFRWR